MENTLTNTKIISYLSFKLDKEYFAANVSKVVNILEMTPITKVPKTPSYLKGIINLRGEVLPVVDLRQKLEMDEVNVTANTCILVLEIQHQEEKVHLGAIVDSVQEVMEIEDREIMPNPTSDIGISTEFLQGMYKFDEHFIMILNMQKIFSDTDLKEIKKPSVNH